LNQSIIDNREVGPLLINSFLFGSRTGGTLPRNTDFTHPLMLQIGQTVFITPSMIPRHHSPFRRTVPNIFTRLRIKILYDTATIPFFGGKNERTLYLSGSGSN